MGPASGVSWSVRPDSRSAGSLLPSNGPWRAASAGERPCTRGKFFLVGDDKLYVRGVAYGTFRPDAQGCEYPAPEIVDLDFAQMAAGGVNAVRTYTPPPCWLLDAAGRHGLRVLAGLPVERSVAFLDYRECSRSIQEMVRREVRACAGHPAVLGYALGNEIPASVVRWHGRRKVERFLKCLFDLAKAEDPDGLVTYVNYPSTEYLQLPFLDFVSFNVYLESKACFDAYLARLHNIAGDRPLIMTEIGLDSLRNGEDTQAQLLGWQVRSTFAGGCAGAFVYSWTDEWYRGGAEVNDWKFGITDRNRSPKPALASVRRAFSEAPFVPDTPWPRVSVVVCSHDGARTLRDCCEGLLRLEYPDYEVIVVDDGSSDETAAIAAAYGFRVIRTENLGLSNARNTGLEAATGTIVAYIDDDAYPDKHWLNYLATTLLDPMSAKHAAVGGPNIAPPDDGPVADCVARAPGGPSHVLLSDRNAEHIPGCNMAFRRDCLRAIGGFDPQFRVAGDDVDVCWRLQQQGWTLGFSPAAMVWHHRRNSVGAYVKQQMGYGKAEAMLERKWPEKYNAAGHLAWTGRVYGSPIMYLRWRPGRIYHGTWGLAPFQFLHEPAPTLFESLPMMPEWYLIVAVLGMLALLRGLWPPLRLALPLLGFALGAPVAQAARCAARLSFTNVPRSRPGRLKSWVFTACLCLLQPMARLCGRLPHGLTFWRRRGTTGFSLPRRWTADLWSAQSRTIEERLQSLERALRTFGAVAIRGGGYDRWDLEVVGGMLGYARLSMAVEYHGDGRQLLRIRSWPQCSVVGLALTLLFSALSAKAALDHGWAASAVLGGTSILVALWTLRECAAATAAFLGAVRRIQKEERGDETP